MSFINSKVKVFRASPPFIPLPPLIQSVTTPSISTVFLHVFDTLLHYGNFINGPSVTTAMHWILCRTVFCIYGKSICFKSASTSFKFMAHIINLPHTCCTVSQNSQISVCSLLSTFSCSCASYSGTVAVCSVVTLVR